VDVALKVIDCDERDVLRTSQSLCVGDTDKEGAGQTRTRGDCDGVEVAELDAGLKQSTADDGNDGTEMLAGGKLWNHPSIASMGADLRRNDGRERSGAALDDGGGGLVARRLDS
jgi:hypothetical protein